MPLEIIVWIGGVLSFLSAVFCIVALVLLQMNVWDMMPVIIGVIAFFGSVNIFAVGIASQYLSKAYLETKNRPLYIAKEKT